ncbi:MAG: TIGR04149 family rSAM-modified RiPP [Tannerella sp.]|jgi:natural product precursor|nr:TIGR04149 family rSAM-modified RiPP [Tannerella sp.]
MKKLGRIKLNQLSKVELEQRKMNALKGGCQCSYGGSGCNCGEPGYWGVNAFYIAESAFAAADKQALSAY